MKLWNWFCLFLNVNLKNIFYFIPWNGFIEFCFNLLQVRRYGNRTRNSDELNFLTTLHLSPSMILIRLNENPQWHRNLIKVSAATEFTIRIVSINDFNEKKIKITKKTFVLKAAVDAFITKQTKERETTIPYKSNQNSIEK